MYAIVLAGVAATIWGIADFAGGKASQRVDPLGVALLAEVLGLPILALYVVVMPGTVRPADLAWGAIAGAVGFVGIALLYRGLSGGAMAVVAPITAVTAALIPITVGLVVDAAPSTPAVAGMCCAIAAIGLVSLGPGGRAGGRVSYALVGLALAAGGAFGLFFALLGRVSDGGGWLLVTVRVAATICGAAILLLRGRPAVPVVPRAVLPWVVAAGTLDVSANLAYVVAVTHGHLSVVAAIASLYPASTVLLAIAVDRERVRPAQIVGFGLAAAALVLASV